MIKMNFMFGQLIMCVFRLVFNWLFGVYEVMCFIKLGFEFFYLIYDFMRCVECGSEFSFQVCCFVYYFFLVILQFSDFGLQGVVVKFVFVVFYQ